MDSRKEPDMCLNNEVRGGGGGGGQGNARKNKGQEWMFQEIHIKRIICIWRRITAKETDESSDKYFPKVLK